MKHKCNQENCEHWTKLKTDLKNHKANIHNIDVKWVAILINVTQNLNKKVD
jgi:hypothetical protein